MESRSANRYVTGDPRVSFARDRSRFVGSRRAGSSLVGSTGIEPPRTLLASNDATERHLSGTRLARTIDRSTDSEARWLPFSGSVDRRSIRSPSVAEFRRSGSRETVLNRVRGGKRGPYCIQLGIVNVTGSSDIAKQIIYRISLGRGASSVDDESRDEEKKKGKRKTGEKESANVRSERMRDARKGYR